MVTGSKIAAWLRSWWLLVPSPRELSVAFTLLYSLALGAGLAALFSPPSTFSRDLGGPVAVASVGALLVAGALLAMFGGARDHWRIERIGLFLMAWALLVYGGIVLVLHRIETPSRLADLFIIGMALVALLVRFFMIWRFTFRPRG